MKKNKIAILLAGMMIVPGNTISQAEEFENGYLGEEIEITQEEVVITDSEPDVLSGNVVLELAEEILQENGMEIIENEGFEEIADNSGVEEVIEQIEEAAAEMPMEAEISGLTGEETDTAEVPEISENITAEEVFAENEIPEAEEILTEAEIFEEAETEEILLTEEVFEETETVEAEEILTEAEVFEEAETVEAEEILTEAKAEEILTEEEITEAEEMIITEETSEEAEAVTTEEETATEEPEAGEEVNDMFEIDDLMDELLDDLSEEVEDSELIEIDDYETPLGLYDYTTAVTKNQTELRESADGTSAILVSIPEGTEVVVVLVEDDWAKVVVNNQLGYIFMGSLKFEEEEVQAAFADVEAPEMKVTIFSSRRSVMTEGEDVVLTSQVEGFEEYETLYVWECDKGSGFETVEGANGASYSFKASAESLSWNWRLTVYYR